MFTFYKLLKIHIGQKVRCQNEAVFFRCCFTAGIVDEVRVYDRALSETEVGDLYRMGQVIIKR